MHNQRNPTRDATANISVCVGRALRGGWRFVTHQVRWLAGACVVFICFFFVPATSADETPKRIIEDVSFETIETGLEIMSCCLSSPTDDAGVWLTDDLLLLNVLRDVPNANRNRLEQVVVFNLTTRSTTQLVAEGRFNCWDEETEVAAIGPGYENQKLIRSQYKYVRLTKEGKISELSEQPPFEPAMCILPNKEERFTGIPGFKSGAGAFFRDKDGYISYLPLDGSKPKPTDYAVWARPNKPPMKLPILREEIDGGRARYLAFSGQYLLNHWDSQSSARTNRVMNPMYWGDRPYDLTPYRLLSLDGTITEIPYPKILWDYGVKTFDTLLPTKAGIMIEALGRPRQENGLLLLQGEKLLRFWGKKRLFVTTEGMSGTVLSPDGCKIAFYRYADWKVDTHKYITIINLCKRV
ncbi:MAG: hypothetical protein HQL44_14585 [Alphaproteobacteria bacterium]|nr:hypothetical protein [Alphaproteobacteria bacterium]